jgi:hypothetical protein
MGGFAAKTSDPRSSVGGFDWWRSLKLQLLVGIEMNAVSTGIDGCRRLEHGKALLDRARAMIDRADAVQHCRPDLQLSLICAV